MKFVPSISIKNGHVVNVENGQYAHIRNEKGRYLDPVSLLKKSDIPGDEVFVLDIDGLETNRPDLDTVKRMAAHREIWLDGGAGDAGSMMDMFISDASRVVMGTICMRSLGELRKALDISDDVIFSMGYDRGMVSPDPKLAGMAAGKLRGEIEGIPGLRIGLFFDLGGIRDRKGVDIMAVSEIAPAFEEFYVSGHVTPGDFDSLEQAGVDGIIMDFRKLEGMSDE